MSKTFLICAMFGLFTAVSCNPVTPLTDWQKAHDHAKAGKTTRLTIKNASGGKKFTVFLVD